MITTPAFSITGETENEFFTIEGETLVDLLAINLRISATREDFIRKVTYHITDETSRLCAHDVANLEHWYNQMEFLTSF